MGFRSFSTAIEELAFSGVLVGQRLILPGDEDALLPEEAPAFDRSIVAVRRASGAARLVARNLLRCLGYPEWPIKRTSAGAPIWPEGIRGSLAHDSDYAVAAICREQHFRALGIDVEPAELLPRELAELVATPREREHLDADGFRGRMLFVAKEAVYKAVYPLDRIFLDHHDIEIDFANREATICNGRVVHLRFCASPHLAALAFIPAGQEST
ncbi:4'-phosphopantetheinyl transferase superfamily protein [Mesorhizobium sp. BAC0120]|uniref:4'-phosphopantetheinyl transferase family protein n=1 Tax=Mesorhizobium sp. BAC0120 TaxID=3090670 RepID=UPI00298C327A|nr:4'-phosphopantetheinyl transferase superfamily protein [Mesorhizobium sp. BAC0120]MDW6023717.1 4'-phosphopantetheinyl transferase superfamily protein [Mesorhizobium sp. BAC0120]